MRCLSFIVEFFGAKPCESDRSGEAAGRDPRNERRSRESSGLFEDRRSETSVAFVSLPTFPFLFILLQKLVRIVVKVFNLNLNFDGIATLILVRRYYHQPIVIHNDFC